MSLGILYGIGVGPGDSSLLTEKAIKALSASGAVCVPISKAERESVAFAAAKKHLPTSVTVVELLFPMTRDDEELAAHWEDAAAQVAALLAQYPVVSFLTIGDPMLYSTFGYLMQYLRKITPQVTIEVIPGISSINAAAALLKIPLVEKNERLLIIPAPVSEEEFRGMAAYVDTVVFLKVSAAFDSLLDILEKTQFSGETYLVSRCGSKDEYWTNDPFALRGQKIDYLSLLIAKRRKVQ